MDNRRGYGRYAARLKHLCYLLYPTQRCMIHELIRKRNYVK